jgi:hypothetical protein
MTLPTKRARIIQAIADRLKTITRANGYQTDIGMALTIGGLAYGPDDADEKLVLRIGDTEPTGSRGLPKSTRELPLQILIVSRRWHLQTWVQLETLLGDVKRAIHTGDNQLAGLLSDPLEDGAEVTLPNEEGTATLGLAVAYTARYVEVRGAP